MMGHRIACIVLNYNNYQDTIKCVDNLLEKHCPVSIVIPDNNSVNDSYGILMKYYQHRENVFVLKNSTNSGYAAGNNVGIRFAIKNFDNLEYICIMNPDTLFDESDLLEELEIRMDKHPQVAVIAPIMFSNGKKDINHTSWSLPGNIDFLKRFSVSYKWENNNELHYIDNNMAKVDVLHGSFFMIRKNTLVKIGLLDEHTFLYSEENIIGFRVRELGMIEALCTDLSFQHNHAISTERQSLANKIKKAKIGTQSRLYICKTFYPGYMYFMGRIVAAISYFEIIVRHLVGNILRK